MSKATYTHVGYSTHPTLGIKVRYANSAKRAKELARYGHTNIVLVAMPADEEGSIMPGDRTECVNFMLTQEQFKDMECVKKEAQELGFRV